MGLLERIKALRYGWDEITFVVLAFLLWFLSARLPTNVLAVACLVGSIAVKAVGLPAKIRKMAKDGNVSGVSLFGNVVDYQSYVFWALYGRAIHNGVLFWGQFPGVILVGVITWLNLRHGSFRWRRKPIENGRLKGHIAGDTNCAACRSLGERCAWSLRVNPDRDWALEGAAAILHGTVVSHLEHCDVDGCGGLCHLLNVSNFVYITGDFNDEPRDSVVTSRFLCATCDDISTRTIDIHIQAGNEPVAA